MKKEWIYNWPQIIRDLQANAYTAAGKQDVRIASESWETCPCGNLCAEIPRGCRAVPLDLALSDAGIDFSDAIRKLCRSATAHEREVYAVSARYCLFRIEMRATELLEEAREIQT